VTADAAQLVTRVMIRIDRTAQLRNFTVCACLQVRDPTLDFSMLHHAPEFSIATMAALELAGMSWTRKIYMFSENS
jgi:hypothetical protein